MGGVCSSCMGKGDTQTENIKDKTKEEVNGEQQDNTAGVDQQKENQPEKQEEADKTQEANGGDTKKDEENEGANQMSNEIVNEAVAEASNVETAD